MLDSLYLCFSFVSNLNYCGGFHVHLIILVYFLTDIILSRVNVNDSKGRFLSNYILLL